MYRRRLVANTGFETNQFKIVNTIIIINTKLIQQFLLVLMQQIVVLSAWLVFLLSS